MSENLISSLKIETLVTFVGFKADLVIEFLRPYISRKEHLIEKIVLFTSSPINFSSADNLSEETLNQVKGFLKENSLGTKVIEIRMKNMWDLREYRSKLQEIKTNKASINLTAGPAVFTLSGLLWAIENNHFIEHSIESNIPLVGRSVVFKRINLNPFMKTLFSTDKIDRLILDFIKVNSRTTNEIKLYLETMYGKSMSLRTVENRVNKLEEMDIVSISKGRIHRIYLSEEMRNVQLE